MMSSHLPAQATVFNAKKGNAVNRLGRAVLAGVGAVVVATACASSAGAAPTLASDDQTGAAGDAPGGGVCVHGATITGVKSINPDGTDAVGRSGPGFATAYTEDLDGDTFTQVVAPAGWVPVTGTDQELATYGIPARPKDPEALKQWTERWSHWKRSAAPGMCTTDRLAGWIGTKGSTNWAGGENIGTGFMDSYATFQEPAFTAVCPTASAYSMWSGLGGDFEAGDQWRLIQTGTDVSQDSTGDPSFAWWELISEHHPNPMVAFSGGDVINAGDVIHTDAIWIAGYGAAELNVYDQTTGVSFDTGLIFNYDGVPANTYYDGQTSEFIAEAPTHLSSGTLYNLRKPTSGASGWAAATTDYSPISSYDSYRINETNSTGLMQTSTWDGVSPWGDGWISCS